MWISGRTTARSGILTLSKVSSETDKSSKLDYWQLSPENGYVPKGSAGADLLSQYDLAKLGFKTEISEPASFDYLNGKTQPTGLIRSVFQSLYDAAKDDTRISHALVPFNYQRLLKRIDSGAGEYSPMDYLRALHNPAYREVVQKTIVKHPSDWYHSKSDSVWQTFLEPLKKEAPEWKKYSEAFLDKLTWMQDVTTEKLGPSLWHMHPVMFLGMLKQSSRITIIYTSYNYTLDEALNKQMALTGGNRPVYGNYGSVTREQVRGYMDPKQHIEGADLYQFVDLSAPSGLSENDISTILINKGVLSGKASIFIQAARKYKVSEVYLVSHSLLETNNGRAAFANGSKQHKGKVVYNVYGIGVFNSNPENGATLAYNKGWFTVDEAIEGGAKWISDNYINKKGISKNTLYKMRWNPAAPATVQYATAINWALNQKYDMKKMFDLFPNAQIKFDIPVYKESN